MSFKIPGNACGIYRYVPGDEYWMSLKEASRRTGLHEDIIYRWCKNGVVRSMAGARIENKSLQDALNLVMQLRGPYDPFDERGTMNYGASVNAEDSEDSEGEE